MVGSFTLHTRARVPLEQLFDLSLSIEDHVASMSESGEKAIDGVTTGAIGLGETVTWRARHFGIWFTMSSKITSLERPNRFVDEQVRGPFRSFRHVHEFTSDGAMTVMTDTITLASPIFGPLAERLVLVPYLRRLIRRRNHHLLTALEATPSTEPNSPVWRITPGTFHRSEVSAFVGTGIDAWERAARDVLRWKVKTRSGFMVSDAQEVTRGARLTVTARIAGLTVREPVEVADVVQTPTRVGFSYRTRPGHPIHGEEAFIVSREGEDVILTVRSLSAPATEQPWHLLYPALRIAQKFARRRYLRALR